MPFPRRNQRRRTAPRGRWGLPSRVRAALKAKAQKTTDRVLLYDGLCGPSPSELVACVQNVETGDVNPQAIDAVTFLPIGPATPVSITLLEPQEDRSVGSVLYPLGLEEYYVTSIRGHVDLIPQFVQWTEDAPEVLSCFNGRAIQLYDGFEVRAGMKKEEWDHEGTGDLSEWEVPLRDPLNPEEWSDLGWLKRWDRSWARKEDATDVLGACCEDAFFFGETSGVLAGGTGTISTDATFEIYEDMDGVDCDTSVVTGSHLQWSHPPAIRLSLNMKRRLKMKPAEGLTLYIGYTNGAKVLGYADLTPGVLQFSRAVRFAVNPFIEVTVER